MTPRFAKFALVGFFGMVLQLLLLTLLTKFHWAATAANTVAVEIAVLHNFVWHERFTWGDRKAGGTALGRLWRFHVSNGLVSLVGNAALTYLLVERLYAPAIPAALIAIAICSIANFAFAESWVFGPRIGRRHDRGGGWNNR